GKNTTSSTFHVSNLKKCLSDESLVIPMKELRLDDNLNFVEEPVEIMNREVKQLRQSRILIVKHVYLSFIGKIYSSSSNKSSGFVPIASPTLSLFHDDPDMKVMHAYYAKESPISSAVIVPPSLMLSPMFNPQEFFLPEELLPPKKRGRDRSSSSTSTLPQEFKIGESSNKTSLERHEEKIEEILNHLDKLSLDRIENIEDNIEVLGKGQTAIRQLVADTVTAALEAQAVTMACTDNLNRNIRPKETPVAKRRNYKEFISCQPFYFNGTEGVIRLIRWFERTESVFSRSNCAEENKVTFATGILTDDALSWSSNNNNNNNNNYPNNCVNNYQNNRNNNSNCNNDYRQQQNRRPKTFRSYAATPTKKSGYTRNRPLCKKYTLHHTGPCTVKCNTYNKVGHLIRNCRNKGPATRSNQQPLLGCTLTLLNQPFEIHLMPIKLGSFDVIIGMDWLSKYHAKINCDEKVVHIPIDGETLIIQDALSRKERIKPLRVRSLVMTIHPKLPSQILEAQTEEIKEENIKAENLRGMDKAFEIRPDGTRCIKD
nr:reverse transcriptase domain-containing protein [Tanacetum cinerariifolium]